MAAHIPSFLDLNATASRKRGWLVFGALILTAIATLIAAGVAPGSVRWFIPLLGLINIVFIAALVQRLHDAGRSGYWALLGMIPVVGVVAAIIINCLRPRARRPFGHLWAQRLGYAGLAAIAALCLARVFIAPYWIPSGSMKPTLLVGDYILVPYVSAKSVQRGDVLIFRHPVTGTDFIKRLIGLPGDAVQMNDGQVILNGFALPQTAQTDFTEPYDYQGPIRHLPRCNNQGLSLGDTCIKQRATETLPNGRSYDVLSIDEGNAADNTALQQVPPGHYFFLGDNRDNSHDSRFARDLGGIEFVPAENLIGRVSHILFSSAGPSLTRIDTWRAGRYWRGVE